MGLPKIDVPTYELTIPSTEQTVKYRPFLVKEEKVLMMAAESNDDKDMINAIHQIISNCCLDNDVDVNKLASFDLEYFFVKLRARSINEVIEMFFPCSSCEHKIPFELNLNEIEVIKDSKHTNKIELENGIGIMMKYPELKTIGQVQAEKNEVKATFNMITSCIDYIYDKDSIYKSKDTTKKELKDWIEELPQADFVKVKDFFETMPKVQYNQKLICNQCETENEVEIEGMQNFFI